MPADKKWTETELFCMKQFYNKVDINILIDALGRSKGSIRWKAVKLGLQTPLRRLSASEKKFILANEGKLTHQAIADSLNIKRNTVTKFLSELRKPG